MYSAITSISFVVIATNLSIQETIMTLVIQITLYEDNKKMKCLSNDRNSYFPSWVYFLTTFFYTLAFSMPSTFINIAFLSHTTWNLNSIDIKFDRSSGKPNGQSTTFYSSINILDWHLNNDLQWRKSSFGFNGRTFIAIAFYRIYALISL